MLHVETRIFTRRIEKYIHQKRASYDGTTFCGPHYKPHGTRGMSNHYHLRFDTKLGNGVCAIRCIPCDCVACTSMLDKTWIYGKPSDEQERYKTITNCTYSPVLGSFKNCNIIQFSQKSPLLTYLMK